MKKNVKKTPFWQRVRGFIAVNLWVQKFRYKAFGWWYFVDLFYRILSKVIDVVNAFLIGLIINEIIALSVASQKDFQHIILLASIYFSVTIINRIYSAVYWRFAWYKSDFGFAAYLEEQVNNKLTELNWEHIEDPKTEKLINQINMRAEYNMKQLAKVHIDILSILISTIFALFATTISWWIVAIIFAKEFPAIFLESAYMRKNFKINDEIQYTWIRKNQINSFYRSFTTLLEIKISQAYRRLREMYLNAYATIRKAFLDLDKKTLVPDVGVGIFESIISTGVFGYYVLEVIFHSMPIGTFQYTTSIVTNIGQNFYDLLKNINDTYEYYRYSKHAYDLLTMENNIPDGEIELDTDNIDIEFRNVWFKYPHAKKYSLRRINVVIKDNDRVALVGENGAGKSTFLKLLNLLYYPTKGQILINGIDLRLYKKSSLYNKIAVVTQDFARYGVLTVAQNIAIFGNTPKISMKKVREAAKMATADRFIERLSSKYDTYLTKKMDGGTELSTGQWQRIAVARQFYGNRPLVILDEPTAAIDPVAEAKIFYNLYHHVIDKTVIVVSHRYNTVRAAKQIIVFVNGEIIEHGTHTELLELGGYYANAYRVQQEEKKL